MFKKYIYIVICTSVILFSINAGMSFGMMKVIKKGNGEIQIAIYPNIGDKTNPVTLNYNGKLFDEDGISFKNGNKQLKEIKEPVFEFLINIYKTIKNNEQANYIKLWDVKYRNELEDFYKKNPDAWEKFYNLIKNLEDYRLMAIIKYGDYTIVQILNIQSSVSYYPKTMILLGKNGKYWITNDLKDDAVFTYLSQIDAQRYIEDYKEKKAHE